MKNSGPWFEDLCPRMRGGVEKQKEGRGELESVEHIPHMCTAGSGGTAKLNRQ